MKHTNEALQKAEEDGAAAVWNFETDTEVLSEKMYYRENEKKGSRYIGLHLFGWENWEPDRKHELGRRLATLLLDVWKIKIHKIVWCNIVGRCGSTLSTIEENYKSGHLCFLLSGSDNRGQRKGNVYIRTENKILVKSKQISARHSYRICDRGNFGSIYKILFLKEKVPLEEIKLEIVLALDSLRDWRTDNREFGQFPVCHLVLDPNLFPVPSLSKSDVPILLLDSRKISN